jgi:hypothetical protein
MATPERLRPPVDLDALASWIYERGLGAGPITNVHKLGGGIRHIVLRSNLPRLRDEAPEKFKVLAHA